MCIMFGFVYHLISDHLMLSPTYEIIQMHRPPRGLLSSSNALQSMVSGMTNKYWLSSFFMQYNLDKIWGLNFRLFIFVLWYILLWSFHHCNKTYFNEKKYVQLNFLSDWITKFIWGQKENKKECMISSIYVFFSLICF